MGVAAVRVRFIDSRQSDSFAVTMHPVWFEQCEAAREIENHFGVPAALQYLIGEKFINFLQALEDNPELKSELPAFVKEIRGMFEPWQLAEYLERARQEEPFDPAVYDDHEEAEFAREENIRRSAAELMLVEQARYWLLEN
jgi:hypothetical protein